MSDSTEDYGEGVQSALLSFMISDPTSFALSQNIIKPDYFDDRLRPAVRYILEYADKYKTLPEPVQIKASTKVDIDKFDGVSPQHSEWYLETVEEFCKYRALESAVLDGVDLIQKGQYGELQNRIKEATTISLLRDLGTSYFQDPTERLMRLKDRSNFVSTGWKVLDDKLYGGFTAGSLNVFAGGSGSGKSLFLQNLALNWAFAGLDVIYITLELSEDLVNLRLDSMVTGFGTSDVLRDVGRTAVTVCTKAKQARVGDLKVKKFPEAGTTANDIRAYLKEYEIQEGRRPAALCVDYLDLMHPNNAKVDVSSLFTKDKYVSEELRALASEWGIPLVTASQLNRQSVEAQEFDHSHIAGGISKINTADNVFGIFTSMHMKERGVYQIQFLKTRSSSAVGQKIELGYNNISMRISDPDISEEGAADQRSHSMSQLQAELKARTTVTQISCSVVVTETISPDAPISQRAHPQHKSREQIMAEKPAQSGPMRDMLQDLIAKTRGSSSS